PGIVDVAAWKSNGVSEFGRRLRELTETISGTGPGGWLSKVACPLFLSLLQRKSLGVFLWSGVRSLHAHLPLSRQDIQIARGHRCAIGPAARPCSDEENGLDLPGQIWSRVNVRLDRNQGGQGHAQETVYARRDYSTSANGLARHRQRPGRARLLPEARHHRAKMRDQLLNGELFYTLKEAQIIIERWRIHYNTVRPHSSLGGQPPAPETIQLAS